MSDTGVMFIQEAVMMVSLVALVGWVLWLLFRRYQIRVQEGSKRLDVFSKLVDKFGDSKEFVGFVQSDEGRKLLASSGVNGVTGRQIALRMFLVAVLLFAVGVGIEIGSTSYELTTDPDDVRKVADLHYWGKLAMGMASGFFAAGILTYLFGGDRKSRKSA